jgi:hypothetical protein
MLSQSDELGISVCKISCNLNSYFFTNLFSLSFSASSANAVSSNWVLKLRSHTVEMSSVWADQERPRG